MPWQSHLGGGVIPCAAFHTTDEIFESFHPNPFYHTSTFGANPMATTAAATTIQILQEENLVERCAEMGRHFMAGLKELQVRYPSIWTPLVNGTNETLTLAASAWDLKLCHGLVIFG